VNYLIPLLVAIFGGFFFYSWLWWRSIERKIVSLLKREDRWMTAREIKDLLMIPDISQTDVALRCDLLTGQKKLQYSKSMRTSFPPKTGATVRMEMWRSRRRRNSHNITGPSRFA